MGVGGNIYLCVISLPYDEIFAQPHHRQENRSTVKNWNKNRKTYKK